MLKEIVENQTCGLTVRGITEVEKMRFYDIEGGFGKSKKAMLVKDIANIHGRDLKVVNQSINMNRKRFKNNIDIVDLKSVNLIDRDLLNTLGFSNSSISNAKNIYILSERGYSKLLKILEDDIAWEQYEKLVDSYFNMRETINHNPFQGLSPELQSIFILDNKTQQLEERVDHLEDKMVIDYDQQQFLRKHANAKVLNILGGKNTNAYKEISAVIFAELWRDYKNHFCINSYRNTSKVKYREAIDYIAKWEPCTNNKFKINSLNHIDSLKY